MTPMAYHICVPVVPVQCSMNVDNLSTNWIAKSLHIVSGDINTILFTQNVREPKWLPTFHLMGAIFSLRELWLPFSRVFVFTAIYLAYRKVTVIILY